MFVLNIFLFLFVVGLPPLLLSFLVFFLFGLSFRPFSIYSILYVYVVLPRRAATDQKKDETVLRFLVCENIQQVQIGTSQVGQIKRIDLCVLRERFKTSGFGDDRV